MNKHWARQILADLAEEAIPSQGVPWEMLQARQEKNKQISKNLGRIPQKTFHQTNTFRLIVGIGLALFLIGGVFMMTPESQALAEAWKHLFQLRDANEFPPPHPAR